jgi:integrase
MIPGLTTNYARHTWATFAAELEIPMETISHALGHKIGSPITAIYIAYNQKKVDDANRKVIDYLNADLLEKGKKKQKRAKGKK